MLRKSKTWWKRSDPLKIRSVKRKNLKTFIQIKVFMIMFIDFKTFLLSGMYKSFQKKSSLNVSQKWIIKKSSL